MPIHNVHQGLPGPIFAGTSTTAALPPQAQQSQQAGVGIAPATNASQATTPMHHDFHDNKMSLWNRINARLPWRPKHVYDAVYVQNSGLYAKSSMEVVLRFVGSTVPRQVYLHLLLRLPALYFSRVAHIFEEADLTLPELKKMALETASEGRFDMQLMESASLPPQYKRLKNTWEGFIDSVMREWKTFNFISVLLLSAILTLLQIEAAAADSFTRFTALFALICALMSLLFGCMYIIRFGTMRKTYKAAEWALEAKRTKTLIWWNVWVLLAMPVIWLTWSIILYIVCIMSLIWRTSATSDTSPPQPLSPNGLLTIRVILTVVLAIGVIYAVLILTTFRRYGEVMDRKWRERIDGWLEQKSDTFSDLHAHPYIGQFVGGYTGAPEPSTTNPSASPPLSSVQRNPSNRSSGYGHISDDKSGTGVPGASAYATPPTNIDLAGPLDSPDSNTRLTRSNTDYNKAVTKRSDSSIGRRASPYEGAKYPVYDPLPPTPSTYGAQKLTPKLAVAPPEKLFDIPSTPPTLRRRTPDDITAASENDDDENSPHVHFRSPLASAHTGNSSPWSYSMSMPEWASAEAGPSNSSSGLDL